MKLNARQVGTAKPKDKPYKMADGGGLYLLVNPNGARYWRLKYRVDGKERLLVLSVYPAVTLADARSKRDEAKRGIVGGIDPGGPEIRSISRSLNSVRPFLTPMA